MTVPIPQPPALIYRGDRYRLNYTAGTVLALLSDYGPRKLEELTTVLTAANADAGIPGGEAGTQWTPPAAKAIRTYNGGPRKSGPHALPPLDPDDDDDATTGDDDSEVEPDVEYHDDLLREHCTYFEPNEGRIVAILKMLDYARLIDYTGSDATATELGTATVAAMRAAEETERVAAAAAGKLTATQAYLMGDDRDKTGTHVVNFTVLPLSITSAVVRAAEFYGDKDADISDVFAKLPPGVYSHAVEEGAKTPDMTVDTGSKQLFLDASLPIRRSLHRHPTYRQFLWLLKSNKNVFALAAAGGSEEAAKLIASKTDLGNAEAVAGDPIRRRIKQARQTVRATAKFVDLVLSGGPEAIWAGKPLTPRDVHADVTAFVAAGRTGFNDRIELGSSLAWETFDNLRLTMGDLERARATLNEGYGAGLVATAEMPVDDTVDVADYLTTAHEKLDTVGDRITVTSADKHVTRTADKLLVDMGIDIDTEPVMSPTGVPYDVMCRHVTHYRLSNGQATQRRCNGHSIGGSGFCEKHGGTYLDPDETQSLISATQQKLFAAASKASEVVIDLMLNASNEAVRLRAAEQIMNRAGLSESRDVNVNVEHKLDESPSDRVRARIMQLVQVEPNDQREIEQRRNDGITNEYGEPNIIDAEVEEQPK